ncbi:tRNA (adenosine(37)-N6)-dimethylallyltransferase MiaA [Sulfurimonas sp. HSL-3221]|uniref:tRNA (adenosine(37)-N6)-dimethylallyltransferase MiaA n=1 Tax=Sulfurimonadaceae TaxID=2771471 RepID=UPI001E65AD94|nr:tRNA (adenosine(37)-N6)-dimethylallyltransferase MiaA [Sulfurimonas sp. HSL-3221]UFS62224.1 tRNA (adenosine(37)-N6)-dimethylallyltransferase MiaA [Sulfurimonas sp. HSL-3221]
MKTIALIGPTASGKSDLALQAAAVTGARILSLDSLSIYKGIDIASAKPTIEERGEIIHYGIDVLTPDRPFDVTTFVDLYRQSRRDCEAAGVPLIIVGGTSFYLKVLFEGISETPVTDEITRQKVAAMLQDQAKAYALLQSVDPAYMAGIDANDRYRTEKMLTIYLQTGTAPSAWFAAHPPEPILTDVPLFAIDVPRDLLRERITLRTHKMIASGLIDEVARLEQQYGRVPNPMKAIGIIEVLAFLDGKVSKEEMTQQIITHTAQLAKRQQTFNRNQFASQTLLPYEALLEPIISALSD